MTQLAMPEPPDDKDQVKFLVKQYVKAVLKKDKAACQRLIERYPRIAFRNWIEKNNE